MNRLLCMLLAVSSLAACGGGDDGSPSASVEAEPNDTAAQANVLGSAPGVVGASIGVAGDVDYYQVTVNGDGWVMVTAETFQSGTTCPDIDTELWFLAEDEAELAYNDDARNGCSGASLVLPAGNYYVVVDEPTWLATFPYELHVTQWSPPTESEPNDDGAVGVGTNDFSSANADGPYSADTLLVGTLDPAGDEDVYAVHNPGASAAAVVLQTFTGGYGMCSSHFTSSNDTYLYVHAANGTILASDDDSGPGLCSFLTYSVPAGETVYVRIRQFSDAAPVIPYLFEIDFP